MFTFRLASAFVGLLLMVACGPSPTAKPLATASSNPTSAATPLRNAVLVGHSDNPEAVVLMTLSGTIIKTIPGVGVVSQHAVGAYLVVAGFGSTKGWTVDSTGTVTDVAPAAVAILSPTTTNGWTPPLIVDSSTAVIVLAGKNGLTANAVDLRTGAVRPLLPEVAYTGFMSYSALTLLDVSSDRKTVWLSKVTATDAVTGRLEILGVDLRTGTVSSQGQANALAGAELAISRDGKSLAGQEEAGTDSTHLAIRHLHVVTLGTSVDLDVQGTAPYVGAQRAPSVLFAPGGAMVAWWGGLDNGSKTFQVNVSTVEGAGRTLYNPTQMPFSNALSGVLWVDPNTMVVQHDIETDTINATTGSVTFVSQNLNYLDAVLN